MTTEQEAFSYVLLGFAMVCIGLFGAMIGYESNLKPYVRYWLMFWCGPPLIKLWIAFVLS
jgi:hypothetical protein